MLRKVLILILMGAGLLMYINHRTVIRPSAQTVAETAAPAQSPGNLLLVWTSADPEVAVNMVFMYTYNAKTRGWWEDGIVRLLVWGPSQKLLVENEELQLSLERMLESGVEVLACRACAENYGIDSDLRDLGVDVHYTGTDLTEMLRNDREWAVVTF